MTGHGFLTESDLADWNMPDVGDAGKIAPIHSGMVVMISAGVETRKLMPPMAVGQHLFLNAKTVTTSITVTNCNAAGSSLVFAGSAYNTLTFNADGETCELVAVYAGTTLKWRLLSPVAAADNGDVDGPDLTTV